MIAKALRGMTAEQLARATPVKFQTWPVVHIVPAAVIAELIRVERQNRRPAG